MHIYIYICIYSRAKTRYMKYIYICVVTLFLASRIFSLRVSLSNIAVTDDFSFLYTKINITIWIIFEKSSFTKLDWKYFVNIFYHERKALSELFHIGRTLPTYIRTFIENGGQRKSVMTKIASEDLPVTGAEALAEFYDAGAAIVAANGNEAPLLVDLICLHT